MMKCRVCGESLENKSHIKLRNDYIDKLFGGALEFCSCRCMNRWTRTMRVRARYLQANQTGIKCSVNGKSAPINRRLVPIRADRTPGNIVARYLFRRRN